MKTFYGLIRSQVVAVGKAAFSLSQKSIVNCVCFFMLVSSTLHAQTYPTGFSQQLVASGLNSPTVAAFAPDGRIFIAEKGGKVRVIKNGSLLTTPFVSFTVDQNGERGLIGLAFDPNFASNHFIYLYHTVPTPLHNRISRFTANGDVAVAGSEVIILELDNLSAATNHNGGSMVFGKDGKLYVGVGENANRANAQSSANLLGKILRINSDGTVPADNPFANSISIPERKIWSYGMRNPYTLAVQPTTGRIFANDVGENTWEEINDISTGGRNFGWPNAEGTSTNPAYANPVYAYQHGSGDGKGCAITGGAFFNPTTTNYPASYSGNYFYQDYCNNWINYIDVSGTAVRSPFATGLPNNSLSLLTGPDGNLYFISMGTGAIYRIIYTPTTPPDAFAITGVTMNNCATVTAGERSVKFTPQYTGLTGQPISFSVANEMPPTTDAGPYTLRLYTDNPTITLKATQSGTTGEVSFTYNWLAACSGGTNTAPTVATPIPPQSATVGQNFSMQIPTATFTDAETPSNLTYSVSGLPGGLNFSPPATISGTPSASGVVSVSVKATDPGNLSVSTTFTLTIHPATTVNPGTFAIAGVIMNSCAVVAGGERSVRLTPQFTGLTGQPISFSVVNEMLPTTNPGPYPLRLYTDNPTITLKATQSGTPGEASFTYNWLAFCNSGSSRVSAGTESPLVVSVLGNPAVNETVDVSIQGALGETVHLQLVDQYGKSVSQTVIQAVNSVERTTLRLGKGAGMYFLQAMTPTQKQTVKIIKP